MARLKSDLSDRVAEGLARCGVTDFQVAVVLGSGLGEFTEELEGLREIPFEEVSGMPTSAIPGHSGRFLLGRLGEVSVLIQQGRVHLYEGHPAERVTAAVRAYARLGCNSLLLTNAAGGLVPDSKLPQLMRIEDHINMQGIAPLRHAEAARGNPYSSRLGSILDAAATEVGVPLERGTYLGLLGPSYETPAEISHFRELGVRAVGMSTVAEASAAHAEGLPVAGISCITNPAAGLSATALNHEEVVEAASSMADNLRRLLVEALPALASRDS